MSKKPLHIEWTDRLLMAPWKYMTFDGRSQSAGNVKNFVHLPENKVLVLSAVALSLLTQNVQDTASLLASAGATLACTGVGNYIRRPRSSSVYLDTYPEKPIPLKQQTRALLSAIKPSLKGIYTQSAAAGAVGAAASTLLSASPLSTLAYTASISLYFAARGHAMRYRLERIVDGHWNILAGSAPPEPKTVKAESGAGQLSPTPA